MQPPSIPLHPQKDKMKKDVYDDDLFKVRFLNPQRNEKSHSALSTSSLFCCNLI